MGEDTARLQIASARVSNALEPQPAAAPKSRPNWTKKGAWDHVIGVVGVPGTGKSTFAARRALELSRTPCYVLAYDPGMRIPDRLEDGTPTGVVRHPSVHAAAARMAEDARGIHCVCTGEAGAVLRAGKELGLASLHRGHGQSGVPVIVIIDEVVQANEAGPYYLGPSLKDVLTGRRWYHVGLIYTVQSPRLCNSHLIGICTELHMFRLNDSRDLKALECLVPPDKVAQVDKLAKYQHITHRPNEF